MKPVLKYGLNLAISVDQFFNALAAGHPDETISSRAHRASLKGKRWGCVLCKALHLLDRDHCLKSFERRFASLVDAANT